MKHLISIFLVMALIFSLATVYAEDTVNVGDIVADGLPAWAEGLESEISPKFIAEFEAQQQAGFDLGTPQDGIQGWNEVVVRQMFKFGDNTGNPWGWGATGYVGFIMLSEGGEQAYSLINEMLDAWSMLGHFDNVGYPTSNQYEEDGKIYQNFSMGYIICDAGDYMTAELLEGEKYPVVEDDPTPTESQVEDETAPGDTKLLVIFAMVIISGLATYLVSRRKIKSL